jgi:hypothetical protein
VRRSGICEEQNRARHFDDEWRYGASGSFCEDAEGLEMKSNDDITAVGVVVVVDDVDVGVHVVVGAM